MAIGWRSSCARIALMLALAAGLAVGELRAADPWKALWISRFEFKTREDVVAAVANAAKLGCKQLLFQVRGNADAYYASSIEPWGQELGGKDPGFDPLSVAIAEAQKAGIEVHAWVNVVPGWRGSAPPADKKHVFHAHPEWFLVDQKGQREVSRNGYYVALNPLLPEARAYICRVMADLCSRYAIDGLHLDYIRFLERPQGVDYGYDAKTLALYRQATGKKPQDDAKAWDSWRRAQITALVRELRAVAKRDGRSLPLTAAVISARSKAHRELFQDYALWVKEGLVDRILPMNYTDSLSEFEATLQDILKHVPKEKVATGVGLYKHEDPRRSIEQIFRAGMLAKGGVALFSYEHLFTSPNPEQQKTSEADLVRARRRGAVKAALKAM
ncbi:MAG: family 10 glycosylhydrolase [Planctomycetes bacterium]|nr:family 10 glycosylhydrolase [Planctomycetota bacterium]